MARLDVNPTRIQLSNLKTRLATATRGHKLLKDKQDELMRRFIELIRKNKVLREEVEVELSDSFGDFFMASAVTNPKFLEAAVIVPKEEIFLDIKKKNVMSVDIPVMEFKRSSMCEEGGLFPYGYAQTSADLDEAITRLDDIMDKLLELAQIEKACQLMANEIEQTRRRVNALEYRTIPDLEETIKYIRMKLDENERSTIVRLMKVKEIIAKDA
ncbi:MAG: V-type ATP synthase subunit D [Tissierellia bacterium]|nr:V-type ATP synthase subunit D [Tissierellia bacterium]